MNLFSYLKEMQNGGLKGAIIGAGTGAIAGNLKSKHDIIKAIKEENSKGVLNKIKNTLNKDRIKNLQKRALKDKKDIIKKKTIQGGVIGGAGGAAVGVGLGALGQKKFLNDLKKEGFDIDKHGYLTVHDKDGDFKVLLTKSGVRSSYYVPISKMSKHKLIRTFQRLDGQDIPYYDKKTDDIAKGQGFIIANMKDFKHKDKKEKQDAVRRIALHEIGHAKNSSRLHDDTTKYENMDFPSSQDWKDYAKKKTDYSKNPNLTPDQIDHIKKVYGNTDILTELNKPIQNTWENWTRGRQIDEVLADYNVLANGESRDKLANDLKNLYGTMYPTTEAERLKTNIQRWFRGQNPIPREVTDNWWGHAQENNVKPYRTLWLWHPERTPDENVRI